MSAEAPAPAAREARNPFHTIVAFAMPGLVLAGVILVFGVYLPRFYVGRGVVTYRRRIQPGRRLSSDRRRHAQAVQTLRGLHPALYSHLRAHRRRSDLGAVQKALYPIVYGRRPRLPFEQRLRYWLDKVGLGPDRVLGRR